MSVIKQKEQRVAVLIDVQNMYHSAKNIYRARVNFREILRTAVAGRKLIRAIAYVVTTESGEERVLRGGSWYSSEKHLSTATRYWSPPNTRNSNFGFRCAADLPPKS